MMYTEIQGRTGMQVPFTVQGFLFSSGKGSLLDLGRHSMVLVYYWLTIGITSQICHQFDSSQFSER